MRSKPIIVVEEHEDEEGLLAASLADPPRFEQIVRIYQRQIFAFLARRDMLAAEDLLGEVWVAAFSSRGRFDPTLGTVRGWLYGIAYNVLRTHARRLERDNDLAGRSREPAVWDEWPDVDARIDAAVMRPQLKAALADLTPGDREVLLLVAWEGLSLAEAAQVLDIPAGTARSRLHRVRRQLQLPLREHLPRTQQLHDRRPTAPRTGEVNDGR